MSVRDEYPAGVPCWVETLQPDPRAALGFYGPLFDWEFSEPVPMPGGLSGEYFVAEVDGRAVAGIGALPGLGGPPIPVWNTHVRVDGADAAVDRATRAGASLVLGPLGAPGEGRLAVLVDPTGAAFTVREAHGRQGAQLVNEPRTWAMSSLHTPDPAAAAAFYGALFGWRAEPIAPGAPVMLFRLPGYVGGQPGQPVPRDVVGVMTATDAGPDGAGGPAALERQPARRRYGCDRGACRGPWRQRPHRADGRARHAQRGAARPARRRVLGQPGHVRLIDRRRASPMPAAVAAAASGGARRSTGSRPPRRTSDRAARGAAGRAARRRCARRGRGPHRRTGSAHPLASYGA